jgi:hypothetical protein
MPDTEDPKAPYATSAATDPALLSGERLAEIRAQLQMPRARNPYVTDYGVAADVVEELLAAYDAQAAAWATAEAALAKSKASEKWLNESLDQKMEEAEAADYHEACATESRDAWRARAEQAEDRLAVAKQQAGIQAVQIADLQKRNALLADDNLSFEKEATALRARLAQEGEQERQLLKRDEERRALGQLLRERKAEHMASYADMGEDHELSAGPSWAVMELMIVANSMGIDLQARASSAPAAEGKEAQGA